MRRSLAPHLVAATLLFAWACAKSNDANSGDDSFQPPSQGGTNSASGGSGATGGTSPTTGGSATGATGGSAVAAGGSGAIGGSATGTGGTAAVAGGSGGGTATGGTSAMAGRAATGGTNSTGGGLGVGGASAGGSAGAVMLGSGGIASAAGGTSGSGTGSGVAGVPNDPNWKPPNMSATAPIIVNYQAGQTAASANNIQFSLVLENQTATAYDMAKVTLRYWMSAEPAPEPALDYASTNLSCKGAPVFVPNMANSYLEFSFGPTGTLPPSTDQNASNEGSVNGRVQTNTNNENFNQANDWSFDASSGMKPNEKITVYDGTTLIWGCEPSHVCAAPPATTGEGGMGGQSAP